MKQIDLTDSVAELLDTYPELKEILAPLGFEKVLNPAALKVMGNIMTISRGAVVCKVPMEKVIALLSAHGFSIVGQEMGSVCRTETARIEDEGECELQAGHPIQLMRAENQGLERILDALGKQCEAVVPDVDALLEAMVAFQGVRLHYAKKEELLMPLLSRYGVTGPSQVMWDEDDEIKKELGILTDAGKADKDNAILYRGRIAALADKARGMIRKEEGILFPLCLRYFTEEEWKCIYRDFPEMGIAFVQEPAIWEDGEAWSRDALQEISEQEILEGKIQLPTGTLTVKQLSAIFSLLPVDITFIDEQDKLRFFINEGNIFPRPKAALGREVYACHPPRIVPVVKKLIADFRAKKRDSLEVARYIMGRPVLVKYMAVYREDGNYLGTVEVVQDCSNILAKFPQR